MSKEKGVKRTVKKNIKNARSQYRKRQKYSKALALYEAAAVLFGKKTPNNMRSAMRKHNLIIRAICKQIPETLLKYESIQWTSGTPNDENSPIWICWLDGPDAMPSFCRRCANNLSIYSGSHPIKFIDNDNLSSYANIPEFINKLKDQKKLGLANYCDILRLCLLYEHGGLWVDCDQFVAKDIPEIVFAKPFVSLKNDYCDIPFKEYHNYIAQGKWIAGVIGSWKGNTLVRFLLDAFLEYCSKNDELIEYMMIDYLLEISRRRFPEAEKLINGNINNGRYRKLNQAMKAGEPAEKFEEILPEDTIFNSLNWRNQYPAKTADGGDALYSAFLEIPEADIDYLKSCR